METDKKTWVLYILECNDGTLYTGITDNFKKRYQAHVSGKGAKYTRGRGPLVLRYLECCENHSSALRREIAVKRLRKPEKLVLCEKYMQENSTP